LNILSEKRSRASKKDKEVAGHVKLKKKRGVPTKVLARRLTVEISSAGKEKKESFQATGTLRLAADRPK